MYTFKIFISKFVTNKFLNNHNYNYMYPTIALQFNEASNIKKKI